MRGAVINFDICFMMVITTEITEEEYNRLWATNVAGTFNFSKRLAPLINEGGRSTGASP
jgi:NAD(P)-dependent dehydrogenase (short-subunit alcohol dehydrogenase family)